MEVSLKTGDIAWTGSRSGARSDETTISLEARSDDVSRGRLEETNIGSISHKHWRGVKNLEVSLKTGAIAWTGSRSGAGYVWPETICARFDSIQSGIN